MGIDENGSLNMGWSANHPGGDGISKYTFPGIRIAILRPQAKLYLRCLDAICYCTVNKKGHQEYWASRSEVCSYMGVINVTHYLCGPYWSGNFPNRFWEAVRKGETDKQVCFYFLVVLVFLLFPIPHFAFVEGLNIVATHEARYTCLGIDLR